MLYVIIVVHCEQIGLIVLLLLPSLNRNRGQRPYLKFRREVDQIQMLVFRLHILVLYYIPKEELGSFHNTIKYNLYHMYALV